MDKSISLSTKDNPVTHDPNILISTLRSNISNIYKYKYKNHILFYNKRGNCFLTTNLIRLITIDRARLYESNCLLISLQ